MNLNKEQLQKLFSGKPEGTSDEEVLQSLIRRGHTFEGMDKIDPEYMTSVQTPKETTNPLTKIGEFVGETTGLSGAIKAVGAASVGGQVAEKGMSMGLDANKLVDQAKTLPMGDPKRKELLLQAKNISGTASKGVGKFLEEAPTVAQGAGSFSKLGLTALTTGAPGASAALGIKGATGLAIRAGEGGVIGALFKATDNLEKEKPIGEGVGTAAAIGAAIPIVGSALSKGKELIGKAGQKIQYTVIKPSAADVRDGFDINTIKEFNLGGSLGQTAHKTQDKLDELTRELQSKVNRTDVTIDLNEVYGRTIKDLIGNKAKSFGSLGGNRRILEQLQSEIDDVSGNGLVDLAESQTIKQAAGLKGSWVYGSADPDASAVEKVYTAFYHELKKEIENKAPAGVREINQQISKLIPVMNAVIRRIPVAERNNVFSLTDVISAGFGTVHPSGAVLMAVNKLSKSGRFGNLLSKVASKTPVTNVGKRIFGQ